MFDLLQLHDKEGDRDMKGFWIKARGKNLNRIVTKMINDLIKTGITKQYIASELSKVWDCHKNTGKRHIITLAKKVDG